MRLDEQGSVHSLELEEPVGKSKQHVHPRAANTHTIDVSCRTQVTLDKEEVGLQRRQSVELVAPTRTSLQESQVSLEEVVNVVEEVKRDLALLKVVKQILVCSASQRRHELQLDLGSILETRLELL